MLGLTRTKISKRLCVDAFYAFPLDLSLRFNSASTILYFHKCPAKSHRVGDSFDRRLWIACTSNDQSAKVENSPKYTLLNLNTFDFAYLAKLQPDQSSLAVRAMLVN